MIARALLLPSLALALVSAAVVPEVAQAQSCGAPSSSSSSSSSSPSSSDDSSSSSSGGSTSSSWGGSSSSSSSAPPRPACRDATDITGLEKCTRFGAGWSATWPALRFELGPSFRRLSLDGITFGGETYHDGNPHRFTLEASDLEDPSVVMGGVNFRITSAIGRHFILGAELDASFGGSPAGVVTHGDRSLSAGDVWSVGGGLVLGLSLPVGPIRFRGEVLAGGQGVGVTATSQLGDCISETSSTVARWVVEPRVGIELFVARFLSIDIWGGADVVNAGSYSGGLRFNLHTRSYDAVR